MSNDGLQPKNEDCYTDPNTGERICISTKLTAEKAVLEIEGSPEVIEKLRVALVAKINTDSDSQ